MDLGDNPELFLARCRNDEHQGALSTYPLPEILGTAD